MYSIEEKKVSDMHYLGWKPPLPDIRDRVFLVNNTAPLPFVDLVRGMPPVYDQGQLGSCTANVVSAAIDYERNKQGLGFAYPSRLFAYYCTRSIEHTTRIDAGASIKDAYKAVNKYGICPETDWPYVVNKFATRPNPKAFRDAKKDVLVQYETVPVSSLINVISVGLPVGIGISVYSSFESQNVASNGHVPMPSPNEQLLGGHAILLCGYDVNVGVFKFRNSWGTSWGEQGYGYIPFGYVYHPQLASDFWAAQLVKIS